MQKLFISHSSALEFYRNARVNQNLALENPNPTNNSLMLSPCSSQPGPESFPKNQLAMLEDLPFCGEPPIHILTSNKNFNRQAFGVIHHYTCFPYSRSSFLKYDDTVYISSPQLLFCQLASTLTVEQLMIVGMEMCGTYSPASSSPEGFVYNIPQLTTALKIRTYVKRIAKWQRNYPGIKNALTVSSLLINNAASPQESILYLKLSTPRHLGGYEILGLEANNKIELSSQAREVLKYPTIKPDLCNKKTKVAIEYDSNTYHDNIKQNEKDKMRASALQYDG